MANKLDLSSWEGQTILKVTQDGPDMRAEAAIAVFTFLTGTRVRLHANDLGQWVTSLPPEGAPYRSWLEFMTEYSHGVSEEPLVEVLPGVLRFTRVSSGDTYDLDLKSPQVADWHWTEKVLTHPRGLELLSDAAACGCFWRICFNRGATTHGGVPLELYLAPEDVPSGP